MPNSTPAFIRKRLTTLRHSLHSLDRALADFAVAMRDYRPVAAAPTVASDGRRRSQLSRKARAAMKLQGRYMGYMRRVKPAQEAMVRAVLAKSGKKAAIRKAQELAGKRKAA